MLDSTKIPNRASSRTRASVVENHLVNLVGLSKAAGCRRSYIFTDNSISLKRVERILEFCGVTGAMSDFSVL